MTTAMKLREAGLKEGIERGMIENTHNTILRFYTAKKLELKTIADMLDLKVSFIKKVLSEEGLIKS